MLHCGSRIASGIARNGSIENRFCRLATLDCRGCGVSLLLVFIAGASDAAGKFGPVPLLDNMRCLMRREIHAWLAAEGHAIP